MTGPLSKRVVAVDLGASSGRVMAARVGPDTLELTEVARFDNVPVRTAGTLHWDVLRLYRGILDGLRVAGRSGHVDSIGIDSWAVDYGLLDVDGRLLGNPVHYRDARTDGVLAKVLAELTPAELYATTGTAFQPFNTLVQLVAAQGSAQLLAARHLLLMPDLLGYWLTGVRVAELTNASTTQLLDIRTRQWADAITTRAGVPRELLPEIVAPGTALGDLTAEVREETGLAARVTAVCSHDTASAVAGVPARGDSFAFISCGTWSLVGVELPAAVLTEASRTANFTNELGVDGTVRYLRNVMGLWLLQESLRTWRAAGLPADLAELLTQAAKLPALRCVVDADDPAFLAPGDLPARIAAACRRAGQPVPDTPAQTVRCIVDSLALAHRDALADAQRLSGRDVEVVHIIGGGARNELLCQLTADACGMPVEAGPVEATALGNVLVQARALGVVGDDLPAIRALIRATHRVRRYEPAGDLRAWRREV
jgi:rhamnulokinase